MEYVDRAYESLRPSAGAQTWFKTLYVAFVVYMLLVLILWLMNVANLYDGQWMLPLRLSAEWHNPLTSGMSAYGVFQGVDYNKTVRSDTGASAMTGGYGYGFDEALTGGTKVLPPTTEDQLNTLATDHPCGRSSMTGRRNVNEHPGAVTEDALEAMLHD